MVRIRIRLTVIPSPAPTITLTLATRKIEFQAARKRIHNGCSVRFVKRVLGKILEKSCMLFVSLGIKIINGYSYYVTVMIYTLPNRLCGIIKYFHLCVPSQKLLKMSGVKKELWIFKLCMSPDKG